MWCKAVRRNFSRGGGGQDYLQSRGVSPLPQEGAFAYLRLKLNDLVHTFSIKKSKKKIHIHGKCVFLTLG